MKKVFYILFAATAALFVSCSKEVTNDIPNEVPQTGETITFTATINMPAATKAVLDGLNIKWANGDHVGIATDNNAEIKVYPITVDASDATKCTITVDAVEGATEYYAVFKGSLGHDGGEGEVAANDFSAISFDTTTKTFSGLTVGNQQVAAGSLSSHLWYTNGYPLAMAGKADGTALEMNPCLALIKLQIDAESVPADYLYITDTYTSSYNIDHTHGYSAVRGFNFYQLGSSTVYSSGDFNVQIASDGSLTTTAVSDKEYRQISQSGKLSSGTDYYMCVIPGGNISAFKIDFLGYKDNSGTLEWNAVYSMTKSGSVSVNPGDFFDLGTLNPLGRKKAKNEAQDEAEDEIAGSYVPAAVIDGEFDDWEDVTEFSGERPGGSSNSRIAAWKMTSDELNLYFYLKLVTEKITNSRYIYVGFDTDNDEATGSSHGGIPGLEKYVVVYPAVASSDPVEFVTGADPRSTVNGSSDGTIETWGVYDDPNTYSLIELCIPRNKVSLTSAGTISVAVSYNDYNTAKQSIVLE